MNRNTKPDYEKTAKSSKPIIKGLELRLNLNRA
jgi:hypothetical protein